MLILALFVLLLQSQTRSLTGMLTLSMVLLLGQTLGSRDMVYPGERCDLTVWKEGSIAYIGTSTLQHLNADSARDPRLVDRTHTSDFGVVCDPSAVFYDESKTRIRFLSDKEDFSWGDISDSVTMLNITCRYDELKSDIIGHDIRTSYGELKSLALRCQLGRLDRSLLGPPESILILDLSNNGLVRIGKEMLRYHESLTVLILNNNNFKSISPDVFRECYYLNILNIINSFSSFPQGGWVNTLSWVGNNITIVGNNITMVGNNITITMAG